MQSAGTAHLLETVIAYIDEHLPDIVSAHSGELDNRAALFCRRVRTEDGEARVLLDHIAGGLAHKILIFAGLVGYVLQSVKNRNSHYAASLSWSLTCFQFQGSGLSIILFECQLICTRPSER